MNQTRKPYASGSAAQKGDENATRFLRFAQRWADDSSDLARAEGFGRFELGTLLAFEVSIVARILVSPETHRLPPPFVEFFAPTTGCLLGAATPSLANRHLMVSLTLPGATESIPTKSVLTLLRGLPAALATAAVPECVQVFSKLFEDALEVSSDRLEREKIRFLVDLMRSNLTVESEDDEDALHAARSALNLDETFTPEELKTAYRMKAREWHPDRLEGMAPELKDLANSKLAEINEAHELLKARSQARGAQPQPGQEAGRSREELLEQLERYRDDSAPVLDESREWDFTEANDDDRLEEEDHEEGIVGSYVDRHPVSAVLFVLFVLVLAGIYGWGMWLGRDRPTAAAQATSSTAGAPSPVDLAPGSDGNVTSTPLAGDVEQPSTPPTAEQTGNTSPSALGTVEVLAQVQDWADDMTTNDPDRMSARYADQVERYYLQKNITREDVRASMAEWLGRGNRNVRFDIRNPTVRSISDQRAVVDLTADAEIQNGTGSTDLTSRSELTLVRIGDAWKICSKRDFR